MQTGPQSDPGRQAPHAEPTPKRFPPTRVEYGAFGCRVQGAGCRVQGAGCRVQGAGCRVQGAGCRAHASTSEHNVACAAGL